MSLGLKGRRACASEQAGWLTLNSCWPSYVQMLRKVFVSFTLTFIPWTGFTSPLLRPRSLPLSFKPQCLFYMALQRHTGGAVNFKSEPSAGCSHAHEAQEKMLQSGVSAWSQPYSTDSQLQGRNCPQAPKEYPRMITPIVQSFNFAIPFYWPDLTPNFIKQNITLYCWSGSSSYYW